MNSWLRTFAVAALACVMAACGSGGSKDDDDEPAVTFVQPLTVTVQQGDSKIVTLNTKVAHPDEFAEGGSIFAFITQPEPVLTTHTAVGRTTGGSGDSNVTFILDPTLSVGVHQGQIKVRLCHDANCAKEFRGSPVTLDYKITVTPVPLTVTTIGTTFSTRLGSNQTLAAVIYVGANSLQWTAASDSTWLTVGSTSGTSYQPINLMLDTRGFTQGTHMATLTLKTAYETKAIAYVVEVTP